MDTVTTGSNNVAIGFDSLGSITSGAGNVAIGTEVAKAMNGGESANVIIGHQSGLSLDNDSVDNNVIIGHQAVGGNSGARNCSENVFIGKNSGGGAWAGTGRFNVAIGMNTFLGAIDGAENNVVIGHGANISAVGGDGQIAIGQGVTCIADNTITVGIGSNTASLGLDGSDTSWASASSDKRLKENIELSLAGLDVINDLRPVTYNWKKAKDVQKDLPQYKDSNEPVLGTKYGERLHGFIAQEVKEVIDNHDELKDGFKMWKLKDDGTQTVADGNLIPILVKAVQELSTEINNLKQQLKDK